MKFQVFLIAVVVMMTGGAIMVAQSVPSGYRSGSAPSSRIQIPPAADTNTSGEAQTAAAQADATTGRSPGAVAASSGIQSPISPDANTTDEETAGSVAAGCGSSRKSGDQSSLGVHLTSAAVAVEVRGHGAKARCPAAAVSMGKVRHTGEDDHDTEAGD